MVFSLSSVIANILIIRWLKPSEAGIWQTLLLYYSYLSFVQLGQFNGLNIEYPFQIGAGNTELATKLAQVALWQARLSMMAGGLFFFFGSLFVWEDIVWRYAMFSMIPFSTLTMYNLFLSTTYRTNSDFTTLSKVQYFQTILALVTTALVWRWGFNGLCIRFSIVAVFATLLLHAYRPLRISPSFSKHSWITLFKVGGPVLAFGYITTLSLGFDRLLLLGTAGVTAVGLYTPALAIKSGLFILPNVFGQFITPRLSSLLGQTNSPKALKRLVLSSILVCALMLSVVSIGGWFIVPALVRAVFPQYTEGTIAAQWILISGVFGSIRAGTPVLPILKAWKSLTFVSVVSLFSRLCLPFLGVVVFNSPLEGIAIGWTCSEAIVFAYTFFTIQKNLNHSKHRQDNQLWLSP